MLGDNDHGQLGLELKNRTASFNPRTGAGPFTVLTAGGSFVCGLRAGHTLWCWGANNRGRSAPGM